MEADLLQALDLLVPEGHPEPAPPAEADAAEDCGRPEHSHAMAASGNQSMHTTPLARVPCAPCATNGRTPLVEATNDKFDIEVA